MNRLYYILPALLLLLVSCEREIDIDYRSVEPIYVVEAPVSDDGMKARVSQTQDMDDNNTISDVTDARVIVTGSDGSETILKHQKNGNYQSTAKGEAGVTYQIDVEWHSAASAGSSRISCGFARATCSRRANTTSWCSSRLYLQKRKESMTFNIIPTK